jgi:hypothetical protein
MRKVRLSELYTAGIAALFMVATLAGTPETFAAGKAIGKAKPKAPGKGKPTTYSGRATVVSLNKGLLSRQAVVIADTGPLPKTGGTRLITVTATNVGTALALSTASASAVAGGTESRSEASVQNFSLVLPGTNAASSNIIAFSLLRVVAEVECVTNAVTTNGVPTNGVSVLATTQIEGLTINGVPVTVTGETNQVVTFPGGSLTLNMQRVAIGAKSGNVTVAGIAITTPAGKGTIGLVHADVKCGTRLPDGNCADFVTGGGYITGTPSGERANFSLSGGVRGTNQFWGHLCYTEHGSNGVHVVSTNVTAYTVVDVDTRMITYSVDIGGVPGTATVLASDLGEPGRDDILVLEVSTGYRASGDLGGATHGGGNIQLHRPKCRD